MEETLSTSGATTGTSQASPEGKGDHARGLLLVGLFKLSKAIFFGSLALGALHLVHSNVGDLVMEIVNKLPIDPEGRFVSVVMDKADGIDNHHLRQAGILSFSYACLCVVEGIGLMRRKEWAEYLTIVLTAGALPWESWEMYEKFTWFKVGFMAVNVGLLIYLLWMVRRLRQKRASGEAEGRGLG